MAFRSGRGLPELVPEVLEAVRILFREDNVTADDASLSRV